LTNADRAGDVVSREQRAILLAVYGLLVSLRCPWLMLHGRIFGEEGTVYLRTAWLSRPLPALIAPHLGYYALWPDLCGIFAAHLFSLSFAPLVMTWCAFLVELLTGYLVMECEVFTTVRAKAAALVVLLLAANLEVRLNTINSQFYLAVCAAIIFISRSDRLRLPRTATLVLGALTGPIVASLTPLFLVRAILTKSRGSILQASLLAVSATAQFAVVLKELSAGVRRVSFEPAAIAPVFLVRYICRSFFTKLGETAAMVVVLGQPSRYWGARLTWHFPMNETHILLWALVDILWIAGLAWITADRSDRSSWWLLAMAVWLALFSMYGALGGTYRLSERYAFPSEVLIGLSLLLAVLKQHKTRFQKTAGAVLLTLFLASGTLEYVYYHRWIDEERPAVPEWTSQLSAWRRNPEQELLVWPKGWQPFTLPPRSPLENR
jgi:hypothetical protein